MMTHLARAAAGLLILGSTALCGDITLTATGVVASANTTSGSFATASIGDSFELSLVIPDWPNTSSGDLYAVDRYLVTARVGGTPVPLPPTTVQSFLILETPSSLSWRSLFGSVDDISLNLLAFSPTFPSTEVLDLTGQTYVTNLGLAANSVRIADALAPAQFVDIRIDTLTIGSRTISRCMGDGGDQMGCTDCPCGNNAPLGSGTGCLNSAARGSRLTIGGSTSVSIPLNQPNDLRFGLFAEIEGVTALLTSGDALAPVSPTHPCFGSGSGVQALALDGLRCASVNVRRHGVRQTRGLGGSVGMQANSPWGGEGLPMAGIASAGFAAGQTRFFQALYRDDPLSSCGRGVNSSQAIEVTFTP